jgi:hypothetical protein
MSRPSEPVEMAGCLALVVAHAHDRAFAELAFDLTQGRSQGALLVVVH